MYILAIETTGPYGSVALIDEKGLVKGYADSRHALSHLKDLIPMVGEVCTQAGIAKSEISLIAPSVGPGSFTGIRISASDAQQYRRWMLLHSKHRCRRRKTPPSALL